MWHLTPLISSISHFQQLQPSQVKKIQKNCKTFLEWNYIRRILRHGDQCGLSYSFGFSISFSWRPGWILPIFVDGKLWPATCGGQVTFPAASSVPWTCREPSESLPLRVKDPFECTTYIPSSVLGHFLSRIFSAKSIKTDPKVESGQSELFQQKMWKITTLS